MELNLPIIAVPATIALMFKAAIYLYARYSQTHNLQTRLYLFFLFAFSVQNIAEIFGLYILNNNNVMPYFQANLFYAATIVGMAVLFHLSASLAFEGRFGRKQFLLPAFVYIWAIVLETLLISTPWLIRDFEILAYPLGDSVTRVRGPLYFLFEFYAIGIFASVIGLSLYGLKKQDSVKKRLQNSMLVIAVAPMAVLVFLVLGLLHFGIKSLNWSLTFPVALTYFLIVTAYATHQHRLLDIQFFVPWSKVRKRKTAFYDRIRAMIAEIADLGSVNQVINRLADTLGCPVAFLGGPKPVLAMESAAIMERFPLNELRKIDRIIVANEIADAMPRTHALMQRHHIGAIVPFYPRSETAASWMLLGDSFSEQVYTPLDFRMVEQLFDKMTELFLDKLVMMRTQLADAHRQIRTLEMKLQTTATDLLSLRGRLETLNQENVRLQKVQPADSVSGAADARRGIAATITLLARDKDMLKRLRRHFPQAAQYVGPGSAGFRRQTPPDVIVLRLDGGEDADEKPYIDLILQHRGISANAIYGPGASEFVFRQRKNLLGTLIELLPERASEDVLIRKIQALAALRNATYAVPSSDFPLVGQSPVFREMMTEVNRLAGLREPVVINTSDPKMAAALAEYIHRTGGAEGEFRVLECFDLERDAANKLHSGYLAEIFGAARGGTIALIDLGALSSQSADAVFAAVRRSNDVRVITGSNGSSNTALDAFTQAFRPLLLVAPDLRERSGDIELLVHYFTLQFNLQAGLDLYLSVSDVEALMAETFPTDMAALKTAVFDLLKSKNIKNSPVLPKIDVGTAAKSLDEYVAEFEARLIDQTLRRCGGNKSKAARLLGMRPNTLHYKLERYGLL